MARPSLYVHEPRARRAPLEEYYGHHGPPALELLDELKSDRMEGVYNLSFLMLAFSLFYLFIRSVVESGFLAGPSAVCPDKLLRDVRVTTAVFVPLLPVAFAAPFLLITAHARRLIRAREVLVLHGVGLGLFFSVTTVLQFRLLLNPLSGVFHGLIYVVIALKQHSYVLTNLLLFEETAKKRQARDRRSLVYARNSSLSSVDAAPVHPPGASTTVVNHAREPPEQTAPPSGSNGEEAPPLAARKSSSGFLKNVTYTAVVYPRNVTLRNYLDYIVAPTLVYETSYPRTASIRLRYVAWHALQVCACVVVQFVLLMQFMVPIWHNSAPSERHLWWFCMKLALPSFIIWLLMFWGFFHCTLNIIAELTCFADRQFYREWWNATTLGQFWRMWNILVHEWCLRHLYVESVSRHNMPTKTAALGTFLMSAVMHEYVCLVGFRMLRPYMFCGMLLQVPLVQVSTRWAGTRKGNMVMWLMLILGQSVIVLMYARDFLLANGTLMCLERVD